jgi:hypothetical protein
MKPLANQRMAAPWISRDEFTVPRFSGEVVREFVPPTEIIPKEESGQVEASSASLRIVTKELPDHHRA